jgi:alcohol dehydrogenase
LSTAGIPSFSISRLPRIVFGSGSLIKVPELASPFGRSALVVTGARSLRQSSHWRRLEEGLGRHGIDWEHLPVAGEPSPSLVDDAVRDHAAKGIGIVIGIGGGSAMDAAKAIAGLLRTGRSVMDHIEGAGPELPYEGPSVPFIAVPTTAGTGSEATKNARSHSATKDWWRKWRSSTPTSLSAVRRRWLRPTEWTR